MSQVKKLQSGGTTPPKGKFRMNGRELDGQTAIDRMSSLYGQMPLDEREMFTVAQRAILDGNIAEYDPTDNTIRVYDKNGNSLLNSYTDTKATTKDSGWKKFWDATLNTESHRFKKSGRPLAMMDMSDPAEAAATPAELAALNRGNGWWIYDKGTDGKLTYRKDSATNQQKMNLLNSLTSTFPSYASVADLKKKFTTKNWNDQDLETLVNYYQSRKDDMPAYIEGLKSRIQSNELTPSDIEFLNLHGFIEGDDTKAAQQAAAEEAAARENDPLRVDDGWAGDLEKLKAAGLGARYKDGKWYITGAEGNDYLKGTWYMGGQDFLTGTPFEGGFAINGRLFTKEDAYNNPGAFKNIFQTWYQAMGQPGKKSWRQAYNDAIAAGWRFKGDRTGQSSDYYGIYGQQWNPDTAYADVWSRYFNQFAPQNYNYNILTGAYDNIGNKEIFSYVDPNQRDQYSRFFIPKAVVYDKDTKEFTTYNTIADMEQALGLNPAAWGGEGSMRTVDWVPYENNSYATIFEYGPVGQRNSIWIDKTTGRLWLGRKDANNNIIDPKPIVDYDAFLQWLQQYRQDSSILPSNKDLEKWTEQSQERKWVNDVPDMPLFPIGSLLRGLQNWQDYAKYMASGGQLPSFQFGGTVDNASTKVTQGKTIKESDTDITKAHKMNGTDGGLTSAEWMQIGAAVGDLAGVAASIIPGAGNVVGAAIGMGASTARFAADIKQDGFQAKDAGNFAINLLLDSATILPFLGTGAHAYKAVRVIRSVAQPLLKVAAAAGVGQAAINAIKNLASGKEWTSRDVMLSVQGLAQAGLLTAGGIKKFRSAKLAKKIEDKMITEANKSLKETKTAQIGDFKTTQTPEQIGALVNGKTKAQAIEAIQNLAKEQKTGLVISDDEAKKILSEFGVSYTDGIAKVGLKKPKEVTIGQFSRTQTPEQLAALLNGKTEAQAIEAIKTLAKEQKTNIELSTEQAEKVLKDLGVEFDRGSRSWKFWKKGGLKRGEDTASFDVPQEAGSKSLLHYYLSGKSRAQMLGSENVYGIRFGKSKRFGSRGHLDQLNRQEVIAALNNIQSGRPGQHISSIDRAIADAVVYTPDKFGTLFKQESGQFAPIEWRPGWTLGGNRGFRQHTLKKYTTPTSTTNEIDVEPPLKSLYVLRQPSWRVRNYVPKRGAAHVIYNGNISKPNYYIEFWKKGGKIYRAQNGFSIDWLNNWRDRINNQDYSVGFKMPKLQVSGGTDFIKSPIGGPDIMINKGPLTFTNPTKASSDKPTTTDWMTGKTITNPDAEKLFTSNESSTVSEKGVSGQKGNKSAGGSWDEAWSINKPNLDDLLRAGVTIAGINKDKRLQRRALEELKKRQFLTPHMDKINYNFSDIERGYDSASEPIKNASLQTSSLRDAMAFELSKSQKLSDIQATKSANISKRMMDIDEANRKINAANNSAEVATANEKSKYLTNLEYQDRMLDSQALNRIFSNVINPLGRQFSQQGRTAWQMQGQAEYESDMDAAQQHALRKMQVSIPENIKTAWNKLTAAEKNSYNNDIATYLLEKDPTEYTSIMNTVNNTLKLARRNATANYRDYMGPNLYMRSRQWVPGSITQEAKGGKISTSKNMRDAQEQIAINGDKEAKRAAQKLSDHLMRMLAQLIK